jgi:hypothetical protein
LDSTSLLRSILQAFFAAGISGTSLIQDFSSFDGYPVNLQNVDPKITAKAIGHCLAAFYFGFIFFAGIVFT